MVNLNHRKGDILSFITPDPGNPSIGLVRMSDRQMRYVAIAEGFLPKHPKWRSDEMVITDEQRLVIRIMFNCCASILFRKDGEEPRGVLIYLHRDGVVAAESKNKQTEIHCFSCVGDCIDYYINDFIPNHYEEPPYAFQFTLPTDRKSYPVPRAELFPERLKRAVLSLLKQSDGEDSERYEVEAGYVHGWDDAKTSVHLIANDHNGQIGALSFVMCDNCIWGVYAEKEREARLKVMGSTEAQNMFCQFIDAFAEEGGV